MILCCCSCFRYYSYFYQFSFLLVNEIDSVPVFDMTSYAFCIVLVGNLLVVWNYYWTEFSEVNSPHPIYVKVLVTQSIYQIQLFFYPQKQKIKKLWFLLSFGNLHRFVVHLGAVWMSLFVRIIIRFRFSLPTIIIKKKSLVVKHSLICTQKKKKKKGVGQVFLLKVAWISYCFYAFPG